MKRLIITLALTVTICWSFGFACEVYFEGWPGSHDGHLTWDWGLTKTFDKGDVVSTDYYTCSHCQRRCRVEINCTTGDKDAHYWTPPEKDPQVIQSLRHTVPGECP